MSKINILLTGSSGFVGQHFPKYVDDSFNITSVSLINTQVDEIDFSGIDAVVHLAGIAHRMDEPSGQIYYDVNHKLAEAFAKAAKSKGVKHFTYVSSVKVYGESYVNEVLDENTICKPEDDYGKSKLLGEQALQKLKDENFNVAIVRPPVIYGANVKGNMERLINLITKGYYLPLKGIDNQRSMVYVGNLIELIKELIKQKVSGVFIAGDSKPISTSELIGNMYKSAKIKPKWFKTPLFLIKFLGLVKPDLVNRLFGSFVIDNSNTNKILNFQPPYSIEEGINSMVCVQLKNKVND